MTDTAHQRPRPTNVDELVTYATAELADAIWLDETVHDTAARRSDDIDAAERAASAVNNDGFEGQVGWLTANGWSLAELVERIDELATRRQAGEQPW